MKLELIDKNCVQRATLSHSLLTLAHGRSVCSNKGCSEESKNSSIISYTKEPSIATGSASRHVDTSWPFVDFLQATTQNNTQTHSRLWNGYAVLPKKSIIMYICIYARVISPRCCAASTMRASSKNLDIPCAQLVTNVGLNIMTVDL